MRWKVAAMVLLFGLGSTSARAEHAKINLDVVTPSDQKTSFVDQTPPASGKNPRPVIKARAGEAIKIQWTLTNVYPHKTLENVVVHFFIAPEEKVGQKELPNLNGDVVLETAFEMDFKPGAKAGARNTVRINSPGVYLIRVETRQTKSDHEHFSAIDLVVESGEKP
jgi:hypothetical protein